MTELTSQSILVATESKSPVEGRQVHNVGRSGVKIDRVLVSRPTKRGN